MGISLPRLSRETMRAFVLACVAIAAVSGDAGADADAYTIAQVRAGIPALKTAYDGQTRIVTGVSHGNGLVAGHLGLAGHAYGGYSGLTGYTGYTGLNTISPYYSHHFGKRSADSDADAYTLGQVYSGLPYANAVATGHAHNPGYVAYTSVPAYNTGYGLTGYTGLNTISPYYNAHHFGKRSADSDADAYTLGQVYSGLPFANAVATGHAHNPGY